MEEQSLNWYGVKLVYTNKVLGEPDISLLDENFIDNYIAYEESVVLIQANSFDSAYEKAEAIAKGNENDFQNIYGQTVEIKYFDSIDCYMISNDENVSLQDGLEVYSNIIESSLSVEQGKFIHQTFPLNSQPKYMLLNKEFSSSKKNVS